MNCEQFLSKSFTKKKDFVNKKKLRFNCLASGHVLKDCKSIFFCRTEGCKKSTILSCMKKPRQTLMSVALNATFHSLTSKFYRFTCQTVMSQWKLTHYLTVGQTLADKLKLKGKSQILTLLKAICSSTKTISKLVNFHIFYPLQPSKIPISNAWVVENLDLLLRLRLIKIP